MLGVSMSGWDRHPPVRSGPRPFHQADRLVSRRKARHAGGGPES